MSANSKIQWTDSTHNFWRGCTKVSAGCKNCYAEALVTTRLGGQWGKGAPRDILMDFNAPLRWNSKPWACNNGCGLYCAEPEGLLDTRHDCFHSVGFHRRRVFSLSLGDIFDPEVDIEWLARALDVIRRCDQLTWQIVTKRPEFFFIRMASAMEWFRQNEIGSHSDNLSWLSDWVGGHKIPPNTWIIASAEDQDTLDARIPHLLKIPAIVHGLSCEPLLGPLNFRNQLGTGVAVNPSASQSTFVKGIDWVIAGGESGPHARPCHVHWLWEIIQQCKVAGVSCFVKQLGSISVCSELTHWRCGHSILPDSSGYRLHLKDKKGGDWNEWPADLHIRQFPHE